jgi:GNAT superfamily N-acetyltransferase
MALKFEDRPMTDDEYKTEQILFYNHSAEFGNPPDRQERFGFVVTDNGKFVGASSGLAQKNNDKFGKYFYLSDLLVEREYRKHGYGKKLLELLEEKVKSLGIDFVWTWTAEFEAEAFYKKQGYEVFTRQEEFYPSGHARIGLIKKL